MKNFWTSLLGSLAAMVIFAAVVLVVVLGGWEVGGVMNARSGLPVDVTLSRPDIVWQGQDGKYFTSNPGGGTAVINNPWGGAFRNNRRPSVVAGVDPLLHTSDSRVMLNPAAFTIPQPGTFGNLGRFALHGPGLTQFDFTLHKRFDLTERQNLEFRAEFYNVFNRHQFSDPVTTLNSAAFGYVLGINSDPRQGQFGDRRPRPPCRREPGKHISRHGCGGIGGATDQLT